MLVSTRYNAFVLVPRTQTFPNLLSVEMFCSSLVAQGPGKMQSVSQGRICLAMVTRSHTEVGHSKLKIKRLAQWSTHTNSELTQYLRLQIY